MKLFNSLFLLAALPLTLFAGANSITLKDGRTFSGRFIEGNPGTISFQDDNGRDYRFRTDDVERISFIGYGDRDREPASGGVDRLRTDRNQVYNDAIPNNHVGNVRGGSYNGPTRMLPVGTEIEVRTTSTINSKNSSDGQVFSASVERDVRDSSGFVLIPRGSPAELVVRDANGGNSRNSNELVLDVQAVSVNGQRFLINTEDLAQTSNGRQGVGRNKRTGEFVGGGTALGTLLGAVAGGSKGALIGALAGAAAGAGTQVLTKGSEVRVPSETVLTFRIDQQVYMNDRY